MLEADRALRPALHPVYARLLCAELQRRGFSREAILEGLPLDWDRLHTNTEFLTVHHMEGLALQGMRLSQCPWLGLEVGFRTQAAAHGVLGAAMMASPNLAHAVLLLQKYARLRQNLAAVDITTGDHRHCMRLVHWVPLGAMSEYLYGQLVAGLFQLFGTLTGQDLQPWLEVHWPFDEPPWAEQYQRVAAHNRFGQTELRIQVSSDVALAPAIAADPASLQAHLRECDVALHRACAGENLSDRVRMLLEQDEQSLALTLDEVAEQLHLTPRTLIRKLAAQGQRFQTIHDELRKNRALWMLDNTQHSMDDIALAVGCQDPSNFSRTFKRWFGMTPSAYRQQAAKGQ